MRNELNELLPTVIDIAKKAGKAILAFHQSQQLQVVKKSDSTPVTAADIAAHQLIATNLAKLNDWPLLSEEGVIPPYEVRSQWIRYWLSDPLDGTRGFIQGLEEVSVNIALIEQHQPVLGVIYAPFYQTLFFASRGEGAFVIEEKLSNVPRALHVAHRPFDQLRFLVGQYHRLKRIQQVIDQIPKATLLRLNSSLKFSKIAEAEADLYPRFGPIYEWDTAAGQCILEEAGGKVVDFKGQSLQYNASDSLRCPPFLAVANTDYIDRLIKLFKEVKEGV